MEAAYARRMDMELRALGRDDIPAWARLLAAVQETDQSGEHYNEADLAEEMDNPDITVGEDIVGAFEDRDLVGYFSVFPRSANETFQKVHLEGAVRPDRRGRGVGSLLARTMLERADVLHAERHPDLPARLTATGPSSNASQAALLADCGFSVERWNFLMRVKLADTPAPPAIPEGLGLRGYQPSYASAMHSAHNEAFLDHPDFTPWSDVMWKQWVTGSRNFRPELSYVVVEPSEPERVVGYVQSNEYDAHFETTGRREAFVAKLGTRREFRRRGIAGALLQHALWAYREAGYDEASLDVDSANPTGALGLYERAGFEVESRWSNYVLDRPAVS